jgi:hypothetical protein
METYTSPFFLCFWCYLYSIVLLCEIVGETVLPFPHFREEENMSHNVLLYAPRVIQKIGAFLRKEKVGNWTTSNLD